MRTPDFYGVLGLTQTADETEIRTRFRQLAQQQHPDRRTDIDRDRAIEEFQLLTQAANTLLDPDRRVEYDRTRRSPPKQISVQEETVKALVQRGVAAFRKGNLKAAIEDLQVAAEKAPDQGRTWHLLAQVALQLPSRRAQGLKAAQQAIELEPSNPKYLLTAGRAFLEAGRARTALQLLQKARHWGADPVQVQPLLDEAKKQR